MSRMGGQQSMFSPMQMRPQRSFMDYLPLLLSRGLFGQQQAQQNAAPQAMANAAPQSALTNSTALAQAAQNPAAAIQQSPTPLMNQPPQLFTPTPPIAPKPSVAAAPAAPQLPSWFADPNSAARRVAAQAWPGVPLEQQMQFYADTFRGGDVGGDGAAPGDNTGNFGNDAALGIY